MKKKIQKCECDEMSIIPPDMEHLYSEEEKPGMNHKPNKCKGTYKLKRFRRNDKIIFLCSCCCMFGDIPYDTD